MILIYSSEASVSELFTQKLLLVMKLLVSDEGQKTFCIIPEYNVPVALGYFTTAVTDGWGSHVTLMPDIVSPSCRLGIWKLPIFSDISELLTRGAWHM